MKKRIGSALLALAMLLTLCPLSAFAAEDSAAQEMQATYVPDTEGFPDNDELFAGYVERVLYADISQGSRPFRAPAGNRLEEPAKTIYAELKTGFENVAAGNRTETVFTIVLQNTTSNEAFEAAKTANACLLVDYPAATYWYDKKSGCSMEASSGGNEVILTLSYAVANSYRGSGQYEVDNTRISIAKQAVENAKNVVQENAEKPVYERLAAYKKYICDQVSYNYDALKEGTAYGDPWQLIYVFDGDPGTNVVCEGYSKAFQYLCDLTSDLGADCYTVSGIMSGGTGAGGHMWNIVRIGDKGYLVDVTNCDGSSVGAPDKLFMVGGNGGTATGGYTYTFGSQTVTYKYYDSGSGDKHTDQFAVWGEEILTLAGQDYKDENSPDDFEVTYSPAEDGISSTPYFMVPTISSLGAEEIKVIKFETEQVGKSIEWTLGGSIDGVTLVDCGDGTAELRISSSAIQNYDPGANRIGGYTVTVNARCGTTKKAVECSICVSHRTAQFVQILKNGTAVTADSIASGGTAAYTANVYDQYGIEMDGRTANNTSIVIAKPTISWSSGDTNVVTVNNGAITGVSPGSTTVTAAVNGGALSAVLSVTVAAAGEHQLTVPQTVTLTYGGTASVGASSGTGGTITYESSDEGVVTVDGQGTLTAKKPGTADITVTAAGGGYTSAIRTVSVTVSAKPLTEEMVTLSSDKFTYSGQEQTPTVTVKDGNATLENGKDYTVEFTGDRTNVGSVSVTITATDNGNYTGTVRKSFTIGKANPKIAVAPDTVTVTVGQPGTFQATVTGVGQDGALVTPDVTVTPNPAGSCTVSGGTNGTFTVTGQTATGDEGITLTVTYPGNNNYNSASTTVNVIVKAKAQASITLAVTPNTIAVDDTASASATVSSNGQSLTGGVTYHSSNPAAATVDANGTITAVAPGTTDITAIFAMAGYETVTSNAVTVTVTAKTVVPAVTGPTGTFTYNGSAHEPDVTVTADGKTLVRGVDYSLTYTDNINAGPVTITVSPAANGKYTWTPAPSAAFTIDPADLAGTKPASINVKNDDMTPKTISAAAFGITEAGSFALKSGATVDGVSVTPGSSIEIQLTGPSQKTEISIPVTFTPDSKNYKPVDLTLTVKLTTKTVTEVTATPFTKTYDGQPVTVEELEAGGNLSSGGVTGSWTGTLPTNAGTHTVEMTFTPTGDAAGTHTTETVDLTIVINKADPVVEEPAGLKVISGQALSAVSLPSGWTWDAPETIVNASGTFAATYTPSDPVNYHVVKKNLTVTAEGAPVVKDQAAAPTASPNGGSFTGSTSVTLASATDGAAIYYTTDGSAPTTGSTRYTGAITLTATTTIKAIAVKDGMEDSAVLTVTFTRTSSSNPPYVPSTPSYPSYIPSTPSTSGTPSTSNTLPVTTNTTSQSGRPATATTAAPAASVSGGTAKASVNSSVGNEIVKQAVSNNSTNVVIAPSVTGSVSKAEVSIPASTVGQIRSQTSASLTVSTPVADVTIPSGGLSTLSGAGGTVTVTAEQVGRTVALSVTAGGRAVSSIPGGVTLTVPAANAGSGTVAVLIHDNGTREVVRKSVAEGGSVTIPLSGSAKLEIVDNSKYFADVPASSWAADAVAFASAHELFNGTSPTQFSPNQSMSRGMLAVVLHNLESNPHQALSGVFADVGSSQWYAGGVAWAASKGIVDGYGNGQFGPNDNITREQLAVMLWRYAGRPAASGGYLYFTDANRASNWAMDALRWATEKGIINGKGNGILDPTGQATRAETAQMLKNFLENQ